MRRFGDILVITTETALATVIADVLRDAGYTVRLAGGREEVLAALARDPLALVLLDAFMPELTGAVLYKMLCQHGLVHLPIVLLNTDPYDAAELLANNATDWLAMPFDLDELLACAARYAPR